jgi:predicted enzyme related to lactoylglutathione lyase
MGNPVVHFEIGGKNAKKLNDFYAKNFGWKIDANNPMKYGIVATGSDKGIAGGISPPPPSGPQTWVTVYISVPKIDPVLAKIGKSGGKVVMPRTVLPGMVTLAQFLDPEGNLVGLVEDAMPPAAAPEKPAAKRGAKKASKKRR